MGFEVLDEVVGLSVCFWAVFALFGEKVIFDKFYFFKA
jgi:hypothetical protein